MSAGCLDCGREKPTPRHRYCDEHAAARRRARRTGPKTSSTARGYDAAHKRARARWAPRVERGEVDCHAVTCLEPSRHIEPGTTWHLGHTPDRKGWTGPEHERCNTSEGATRGNRARRATPPPVTYEW